MSLDPTASPRDVPTAASPIADLSYRNYEGPLHARTLRWWVVALAGMRPAPKKPLFWVCVALSVMPYLINGLVLYFSHGTPMMGGLVLDTYATSFYNSLRQQGFFLFLIALLVGAGAIASDVRANALQVYLSKPITKGDYVLGKWMGIFLPVYVAALVPALAFYLFCLLSYSSEGFLSEDRLLILRVLVATAIPALVHSSVLIGISAWSRTAFMAGAFYAALYFASGIVAGLVWTFLYGIPGHFDPTRGASVRSLSLEGIIIGLAQNVYRVTLKQNLFRARAGIAQSFDLHPPLLGILLPVACVLVAAGLLAARARVRAVEVVRG